MRLTAVEPAVEERNRLVVEHVGLVKAIAVRLAHRVPARVDLNELISAGMIGLIDAAGRYQPALGVPFDAFARRRVHGAMLDSLRAIDWAPRSMRRMRRDLDGSIARLRSELNREPSDLEIAAALQLSEADYYQLLDRVKSLDIASLRQHEPQEERQLLDVNIDPDDGPHARLERAELREHLARAVGELPLRERRILSMYYEHELTLAEIGAVLQVSESRVSQLRTQAIARLRSRLRQTLQLSEPR